MMAGMGVAESALNRMNNSRFRKQRDNSLEANQQYDSVGKDMGDYVPDGQQYGAFRPNEMTPTFDTGYEPGNAAGDYGNYSKQGGPISPYSYPSQIPFMQGNGNSRNMSMYSGWSQRPVMAYGGSNKFLFKHQTPPGQTGNMTSLKSISADKTYVANNAELAFRAKNQRIAELNARKANLVPSEYTTHNFMNNDENGVSEFGPVMQGGRDRRGSGWNPADTIPITGQFRNYDGDINKTLFHPGLSSFGSVPYEQQIYPGGGYTVKGYIPESDYKSHYSPYDLTKQKGGSMLMAYGGGYQQDMDDAMYLDEDEINQILAMGGQIEYLD